MVPTSHLKYR